MTTRTRLAGGIAALLLCAGTPAGASSAPSATVALGATVTVTGTTSFVREVTLAKPVRLTHESWRVESTAGRFGGFALDPLNANEPGTVFAFRSGFCAARGCTRPGWAPYGASCLCGFKGSDASEATIPAGRYRLYLVADGGRVSVTLSLPGLRGRTAITSGSPLRPVIDSPKPQQFDPPADAAGYGGNLYAAGSTHRFGERGGIYLVDVWKIVPGAPKSANPSAACIFEDAAAPSFQAPCSGASQHATGVYGQVPTGERTGPGSAVDLYAAGLMSSFGVLGEGTWSVGGYINSAAPAREAHTQALWLDFA